MKKPSHYKVSRREYLEIYDRFSNGEPGASLAREYGVSASRIYGQMRRLKRIHRWSGLSGLHRWVDKEVERLEPKIKVKPLPFRKALLILIKLTESKIKEVDEETPVQLSEGDKVVGCKAVERVKKYLRKYEEEPQ